MSTLSNFGIPLGPGQRVGILMPKVKNRFSVTVMGFGIISAVTAFTQQVITVARPNVSFEPQAVHSYNSVAYYAGKATWETIAVTVRDDVTNSIAALCGAQTMRQMNFFDQSVPVSSSSFKFTMQVDTMDGSNSVGNVIGLEAPGVLESWVYEGCFLSQVNYESFDYSSSDAMTIEMTIRFDNATQLGGLMPVPSPFTYTTPRIN